MQIDFETPEEMFSWGDPQAVYAATGGLRRTHIILSIFLMMVGGGFALTTVIDVVNQHGDRDAPFNIAMGGLLFFLALYYFWWGIKLKNRRVAIYSKGLILRRGKKASAVPWDDIKNVYQQRTSMRFYGITLRTVRVFTMQLVDDTKISVNDIFVGIDQLGATIQGEVTKRLLPMAIRRYEAGEDVQFDVQFHDLLVINKQGIKCGKKQLPWAEMGLFEVSRGYFNIQKKDKWLDWQAYQVSSVANLMVVLGVLSYATGLKAGQKQA